MAIIECPECHRFISDRAEFCPHCGLPAAHFHEAAGQSSALPPDIDLSDLENVLAAFERDYTHYFSPCRYISHRDTAAFLDLYGPHYRLWTGRQAKGGDGLKRFLLRMRTLEADTAVHNEDYVRRVLEEEKDYFDRILLDVDPSVQLDDEQRRAVVTDDDYCLLVAGAGAGKTTTMAAKVKYLVERRGVRPEEIIVISYTNKAVDELRDRINKKLRIPAVICTFHKFAFDIVRRFSDQPPEVLYTPYPIISDILEKAVFHDKELLNDLVLFLGYYFDLPEEALRFDDLEQYHLHKAAQDYETLRSSLGEYIRKVRLQRSKRAVTLTGEYLRSAQEVQIANFLYLNGLDYEYEKVYPYDSRALTKAKLYTPDFYITQGDRAVWLEHYALNEDYCSDRFTEKELRKYRKSIRHKRELHAANHTVLLETWSAYHDRRPLTEHLRETLERAGFQLRPRDLKEVYQKIVDTGKDKYIFKLIDFMMQFIEQYKTTGYDAGGFASLRQKTNNPRTLLFLDIAQQVYTQYQAALRENHQIDFADMINDAHFYLQELGRQGADLPYRYIIIDEFQDIARQRFALTRRLSQLTQAKVVAVGDDWQSIFAFSGSDITLFTRFLELMGPGVELKITHTYRNSQELIDIAGGFVQKNAAQIRKRLISPKHLKDPVSLEVFDDSGKPMAALSKKVEDLIGRLLAEFGPRKTILLVGRYNFDMYKLCQTGRFQELPNGKVICAAHPEADITFLTAHSAKGLGYDNVILINMFESRFGFPCQLEEDPIIRLVTYEDTSLPFAEERRLFYVALTRTRNRVYIVAPLHRPSRFLIELIQDRYVPQPQGLNMELADPLQLRCPKCGSPLKEEFNKNYGLRLWICTNDPEVCDFMTNDPNHPRNIFKCPRCGGYMIVKSNSRTGDVFYGCTNYSRRHDPCVFTIPIPDAKANSARADDRQEGQT